jgi:hypothetical protein
MVNLEKSARYACVLIVLLAQVIYNPSAACSSDPSPAPGTSASDPTMSVPAALMKPALSPLRKSAYATSSGISGQPSGRPDSPTYVPMSSPGDEGAPKPR